MTERLNGGLYDLDVTQPIADAAGGLDAYVVRDRRGGAARLMAVQVPERWAPRASALAALSKTPVPFCLFPLAHLVGRDAGGRLAQFVICHAPPGPPLAAAGGAPWSESELIDTLLRPAATALAALQARRVTHRAIRPNNVFQPARGQPVTLGCAWAGPPASQQDALWEPPYVAACGTSCRDDGSIADDVYALGVVMLYLALGARPLPGLDDAAVLTTKLRLGSAAALVGSARLPPMIADLARGMLAEDPDHRPSPALLADPEMARARRVAARPRRRAQRPITVGAVTAWDARCLAHAMVAEPAGAITVLRDGVVDQWLRRALGDVSLALLVDEAARQRASETILAEPDADAVLLMRAVAALDPLAPLCWRGLRIWPEALGTALADAGPQEEMEYVRMIEVDAFTLWAVARLQWGDPVRAQLDARQLRGQLRQRGWAGGIERLRYTLNPLLPSRSLLLARTLAVRTADILPALEDAAAETPDRPALPIDRDLAAFLAAHMDLRVDSEFATLGRADATPAEKALAVLRVLAPLQARQPALTLPALSRWLAGACDGLLDQIRNRTRREAVRRALLEQAAAGRLNTVLNLLVDASLDQDDASEAARAAELFAQLDAQIDAVRGRMEVSWSTARLAGGQIASSLGLIAVIAVAVWMALWPG